MVKIDIISGFLGAGKTTLIKKLLKEAFEGEQVVLIENEFGEIGIDGGFLKDAGIEIREMNSGCICCSLVGDFGAPLKEVVEKYHPDRILIEPSGVGKLSDVIKAVQGVEEDVDIQLNSYTTVVDAKKCKMYMRNFGEFFDNQVQSVTFASYKLYFTSAAVYYVKKFLNVFNIRYFHVNILLSTCTTFSISFCSGSLYLNFFQIATGFSPSGKKSPTVTNKTRICPILWVFLILNYHGNLKIVCENCSLRNLEASNTGTQQPRKLAADKQRRTDDCHNPAFLP